MTPYREYADQKGFKKRFLGALKDVHKAYKAAKIAQVRGGLRLYDSPPPVPRKTAVVVMLPAPPIKGAKVAKAATIIQPLISEDAFNMVRTVAPGWDRQALAVRYRDWMRGKAFPNNPDAAFLGWVKKFTKGKPAA